MTIVVAALVGFLAGRMLWLALRRTWQRQVFLRKNFQGTTLPTAAGIVLPIALVFIEAGRALAGGFGIGDEPVVNAMRAAAIVAVVGFALLGLLDDLAGAGQSRGFTGHLRALARGELTSGGVKAFGGIAVSLVAAMFLVGERGGLAIILAGGIIALAANLVNLFDLRPGRATKMSLLAFLVIAAAALADTALVPVAIVVGAAAALILDDLRERLMLGDTGANALGAALGLGLVTQLGDTGLLVAFVVLLALNLLSEFVSFSRVIDSVGPLRSFDMMGRRRSRSVDVRDDQGHEPTGPTGSTQDSSRVNVGGAHEPAFAKGGGAEPPLNPDRRNQDRPRGGTPGTSGHGEAEAPDIDSR